MALPRTGQTHTERVRGELQRPVQGRVPERAPVLLAREARSLIEDWRIDYNTERPHTALGGWRPVPTPSSPVTPGPARLSYATATLTGP